MYVTKPQGVYIRKKEKKESIKVFWKYRREVQNDGRKGGEKWSYLTLKVLLPDCIWVREKLGTIPSFVAWSIGWTLYYSLNIIYWNEKAW